MLKYGHRTYERTRYRRKYITILNSCGAGLPVWYALDAVKGLLIGSLIVIFSLYY
jgi:hypothetical protein